MWTVQMLWSLDPHDKFSAGSKGMQERRINENSEDRSGKWEV